MTEDRSLSTHFRLSEFPGWEDAPAEAIERLETTVRTMLEPTRREWGRIVPTSWYRSSGTGAHLDGGTVDFVPLDSPLRSVHVWMTRNLAGAYGELIEELPSEGETTGHIHVTRPGVGGFGESLREIEPGVYVPVPAWELPPFGDPVGPRNRGLLWLLGLAALYFITQEPGR